MLCIPYNLGIPAAAAAGNLASRTVYGIAKYIRGYQVHRGRRRRGSLALKVLAGILAVLLAACLVLVVLLDVEYTDHGVQVRLPWAREEQREDPDGAQPVESVVPAPHSAPGRGVL